MSWLTHTARLRLIRVASILIVLGIWELSVDSGWVNPFLLPAPSGVIERTFFDLVHGTLAYQAELTIYRTLVGFLITGVLGISIGAMMARYALVRWFFDPIVSVGLPMPKISLIPIFIVWFGAYDTPKIVMIVIGSVFPVISSTYLATSGVDHYLLWSAANLGTDDRRTLWKVIIPAAAPQIISGLQIALPLALILDVVSEMLTTGGGLGYYMILAARFSNSRKVFVALLAIGVLGYASTQSLARLRRWLLQWHTETVATS